MKRDISLDFIRVMSMLLVIVIHVSNIYCRNYINISELNFFGATFFNAVARVSVPLFFMISGVLLIGEEYNKDKYKKRIKKFIIILIVWNLIYYLYNVYYLNIDTNFIKTFIESFYLPTKKHLWFMYAIISIYIALPFIQSMFKNMDESLETLFLKLWFYLVGVIQLLKIIIYFVFKVSIDITNPIPIIGGTYYLGYFVFGYILYKRLNQVKKEKIKKYSNVSLCILAVSLTITIIATFIISNSMDKYYSSLFAYRTALYMLSCGSLFSLIILNKDRFNNKILINIINKIVPVSFGIYLSHILFLGILDKCIDITSYNSFIFIPLFSLLLFLCSYLLCLLIKKIPYLRSII